LTIALEFKVQVLQIRRHVSRRNSNVTRKIDQSTGAYPAVGVVTFAQTRLCAYQRAVSVNPDFVDAHYNLGNALKELGKLDEAVSCYEKAISIKPDFVEAQHFLNSLLEKMTRQPPT
jgi:tetratricopeptide (TPR) repeat protein